MRRREKQQEGRKKTKHFSSYDSFLNELMRDHEAHQTRGGKKQFPDALREKEKYKKERK
jgi:hypothetical protein